MTRSPREPRAATAGARGRAAGARGKAGRHPSALGRVLRVIGPGVITGAADDDPSGITTCAQAGAQFGYGLLWTIGFELPLMIAIQEACARIGVVTGQGIAAIVRRRYHPAVLYGTVCLLVSANTINIGADIGAMAASLRLLVPLPFAALAVGSAATILALEVFLSYPRYATLLKWLSASLLAYALVALIVREPWGDILGSTLVPRIRPTFEFFFIATGVLGTTISPYMFFWEASEEVEEEIAAGTLPPRRGGRRLRGAIQTMRIDNAAGMVISQAGSWFIVVATATVLHQAHITDIRTAADAARALEPLVRTFPHAGFLAKMIFAVGVICLGLLGIPVLAGSSSYALSEALGWHEGLSKTVRQAPGFYGVIAGSTVIGLAMNFVGLDPIRALVLAAVVNGVVAVPLVFVIGRIASDRQVMGHQTSGRLSRALIWVTFFGMGASALGMFVSLARGA